MMWPRLLQGLKWRLLTAAALTAGVVHICATFAAPYLAEPAIYSRLSSLLPINQLVVLPVIAPDKQPLPFLAPDVRYAMCRFDSTSKPVEIRFQLPDAGWTVSVLSVRGETLYSTTGNATRPIDITLLVVAAEDTFLGVTPEARGAVRTTDAPLNIAAERGLAIIRAPDKGSAYDARTKAYLNRASCRASSR